MKSRKVNIKTIKRFSGVVLMFLFASCNSFQPGEPPPPGEPIIKDPPPVTINNNVEKPIEKPKEINGKDAVNYMLTSLGTSCRPIASPGKELPEILNRFTVARGSVNDLPMEVWQRLIRNKMIKPISNPNEQYAYSLESEFETLPNLASTKKKYLWKMRLIQNNQENKEIWKAKFEFSQD